MEMNLSLSKPFLRSQMEANMRRICDGQKSKEEVVTESIQMYKDAFTRAHAQSRILEEVDLCFSCNADNGRVASSILEVIWIVHNPKEIVSLRPLV